MKIVMFKQKICGTCNTVSEFLANELKQEPDEVRLMFAGNKEVDDEAIRLGIMQSPTFVLYDNKNEAIKIVRGSNFAAIEELFVTAGRIG